MNKVYLNLGSNIEPEKNIPQAVKLLKEVGDVQAVSSVWETKSVGYNGANFLNVCVLLFTHFQPDELKEKILRPIESQLGRVRDRNKNAPRVIDIDIVLFNLTPYHLETWQYAFVLVPLAELIPLFLHPFENTPLSKLSDEIKTQVWMKKREDVFIS